MEHQKELEVFRKKDPPILTMEEMVESVHAVEALSQLLAKDKQTADVSIDTADKIPLASHNIVFGPGCWIRLIALRIIIIPLDITSQ